MSLAVRLSAEATVELDEAMTWYDDQRPGLGDILIGAVDAAISIIADWPGSGTRVDGLRADSAVRLVPVRRFPYYLAYEVIDDAVQVLAVPTTAVSRGAGRRDSTGDRRGRLLPCRRITLLPNSVRPEPGEPVRGSGHFKKRLVVLSASTRPSVWHVGQ